MRALFSNSVFISCLWLGVIATTLGQDSEQVSDVIEFRTIAIAPYGINENTASGIYFDAANLIAKGAGYQLNNKIYPYARIIKELITGQTDVTIMFKYKELEGHVVYVEPFETLKIVVIGLKGVTFESVDNLKGRALAYLRGAKFSDVIDNDPDIIKYDTTDFSQGIKMLKYGRVDGIIGPLDPLLFTAAEMFNGENIFGQPLVVGERTPWVQVSKKGLDRISIKKLKEAFHKMKQEGQLDVLRKKYIRIDHNY